MRTEATFILVTLILGGVLLPLGSALTNDQITPCDATYTVTRTSTNTTILAEGKTSMMTVVQTMTIHSFSRGVGVTVHGQAGIITPSSGQMSACFPLLFTMLSGVTNVCLLICLIGILTLALRFMGRRHLKHESRNTRVLGKHLSKVILGGGLLLYVGGLLALVVYVNVYAASRLWDYMMVVILPIWSVSALVKGRPTVKIRFPVFLLLCATILTAIIAPLYVWYYSGQVYNIIYFAKVPLSFATSMIVLMSASSWIASTELGILLPKRPQKNNMLSSFFNRFSVVTTVAMLPNLLLSIRLPVANYFNSFSTLFLALMIVPVVYPVVELKRLRKLKEVLSKIGLLGELTLLAVLGFLVAYLLGPIHPVLLVAVCGSFLTSLSSSLGETQSSTCDVRASGRLWRILLVLAPLCTFFVLTFLFSHLSIITGC